MGNFEFLAKNEEFKILYNASTGAEKITSRDNVSSAIMCRRALELGVRWLYNKDADLKMPYQDTLSALTHEISFVNIVNKELLNKIEYVIKLGNLAAHSNKKVTKREGMLALNYLFDFMTWIAYCYSKDFKEVEFDENKVVTTEIEILSSKERANLTECYDIKDNILKEDSGETDETKKELAHRRNERANAYTCKPSKIGEKETRERYIDLDLKIAGWEFEKNMEKEFKLDGMPNRHNTGFADYILYGENGLPLAIVEAKRTSKSALEGKQQAKLYADCVENQFGQRPIIYYTNGFEMYMWDDVDYPPRKVAGYHTQDELQIIIDRRKNKGSLNHIKIDTSITDRGYQMEAVKMVCETFEQKHRRALLVMATGTGKTRVSISLTKVLMENNWVKNVLFLADRTVLINQAKSNFAKLMPNLSCCNLLEPNDDPENSRMIFSTYQTMIRAIDSSKRENGDKLFTAGHFDLIIVDEAHRSIYQKYQAIFEYFDSLVVGLTATPRSDVDKNTYRFFEIEENVPTYAYEYETAVKEGYLVDYHSIETTTNFIDRGIKYSELSLEDKEKYENLFEDEDIPDEINADAINTWLFNRDTIKKPLELLMEKGLKVQGGDVIGKTIIFAKNHKHAEKIVQIFNELYPQYSGMVELIDNKINYAQSLIGQFSRRESWPQIAVSVDMLDTGVDVPEILNLVFFKPVKSKIKFWQMIGRGTRLCKNVFGEGLDKKEFYIFDLCRNFEYFEENPNGKEAPLQISLTERIYHSKIDFIYEFQNIKYRENKEYIEYREKLVNEFIEEMNRLNKDSFLVKAKLEKVEKYSQKEVWQALTIVETAEIKKDIIPLFLSIDEDEYAKRFDNLIYKLQLGKILSNPIDRQANAVVYVMEELSKLGTVPQIAAKANIIFKAQNKDFLKNGDFFDIENVREELRDLMQFLEGSISIPIYVDIEDEIIQTRDGERKIVIRHNLENYRRKLQQYLNDNIESTIIYKIRHNQTLTQYEKNDLERILFTELGNNQEYEINFGKQSVIETVRRIVGLDKETADLIFNKYINDNMLNMKQIEFVKRLKSYVMVNGIIEMETLLEQPFSTIGSVTDIFEDKITTFKNIKAELDEINRNAREVV